MTGRDGHIPGSELGGEEYRMFMVQTDAQFLLTDLHSCPHTTLTTLRTAGEGYLICQNKTALTTFLSSQMMFQVTK